MMEDVEIDCKGRMGEGGCTQGKQKETDGRVNTSQTEKLLMSKNDKCRNTKYPEIA